MALLTSGSNAYKTAKSDKAGTKFLTWIQYFTPQKSISAHVAGNHNLCSEASDGCVIACLFSAGRGKMSNVQLSRINRTKRFIEDRERYFEDLYLEIEKATRKCKKLDKVMALRLNGTSDIPWERIKPELFTDFPQVQFYDYTKITKRAIAHGKGDLPKNYHITYSRSEVNGDKCLDVLRSGTSVAAVFDTSRFPTHYKRFRVHDADKTDLRFLDEFGWQALYAKGEAKKDKSGFVLQTKLSRGKVVVCS